MDFVKRERFLSRQEMGRARKYLNGRIILKTRSNWIYVASFVCVISVFHILNILCLVGYVILWSHMLLSAFWRNRLPQNTGNSIQVCKV